MKAPSIKLDTLFESTRTALENANKSKMADGKKTDAKIQQFIATQHNFRSWHDFIQNLKEHSMDFHQRFSEFPENTNLSYYSLFNTPIEKNHDNHIVGCSSIQSKTRNENELKDAINNHVFTNDEKQKFLNKIIKNALDCSSKESAISLIEEELNKAGVLEIRKLIVDTGYETFDSFSDSETTSTVNVAGKTFIVPNSIMEKLSGEELFDFLSGCYSSKEVRKINEKLGFSELALEQKTRLLESCEKALEESQERELDTNIIFTDHHATWYDTNTVIPLVVSAIFDFFYEYQITINKLTKENIHFADHLVETIDEFFEKHHEAYFENDNSHKMISGLSEPKLRNANLNDCYSLAINDPTNFNFDTIQASVYGYAYKELIKDTLTEFNNLLLKENTSEKNWYFDELKRFLRNNIKNIF